MQHICNQQGKNEYLTQNGKFWPKKRVAGIFLLESRFGELGRVCVCLIHTCTYNIISFKEKKSSFTIDDYLWLQ